MDAIGHTTLTALGPPEIAGESLQLTTDPDRVETDWQPRKDTEPGLEGARTTSDAGLWAIDCFRTLGWSGNGQWLDTDTVKTLRRWLGATGGTFRYEESIRGDDWTVEILPPFKADLTFGQPALNTATLTLHALAVDFVDGDIYTGN